MIGPRRCAPLPSGRLDLYAHETERDPHEEIVRLEEHIEELDAKIESCRKFILASRIAMAAGGIVLASGKWFPLSRYPSLSR